MGRSCASGRCGAACCRGTPAGRPFWKDRLALQPAPEQSRNQEPLHSGSECIWPSSTSAWVKPPQDHADLRGHQPDPTSGDSPMPGQGLDLLILLPCPSPADSMISPLDLSAATG